METVPYSVLLYTWSQVVVKITKYNLERTNAIRILKKGLKVASQMEDCLKQQLRLVLAVLGCCPYWHPYTAVSGGTVVLQQGTGRNDEVFLQQYLTKG